MTDTPGKISSVYWFTGLSGAGKSTIAEGARDILIESGHRILILDGDDVRERLHQNLGFDEPDIKLNNRLIAKLCEDLRPDHDALFVPIISPYRASRREARRKLSPNFFEIYLDAGIETVRQRDVKGLYALADQDVITNMIGYSDSNPYEPPENADLVLNTVTQPVDDTISEFCAFVRTHL